MTRPMFVRTTEGVWLNVEAIEWIAPCFTADPACTIRMRNGDEFDSHESPQQLLNRLRSAALGMGPYDAATA